MKKLIHPISIILVICMLAMSLAACGTTPPADDGVAYVSLRINPEIELVTDNGGEVIAAEAVNEDGEIVLTDLTLDGMSIEEAAEAFAEKATELGYVDVDGENTVYIDAQGESEEAIEEIRKKATDRINKFFENNGIYGKACAETLEEYAEEVIEWGISAGHARMVNRILDLHPDMTEEEVLALSIEECIELIKTSAKEGKLTAGLREDLKEAKKALKDEHPELENLEEMLEKLEDKLDDMALTEEQKALIEEQIEQAEERLEELEEQVEAELEKIEDELEKTFEQEKEALKEKAKDKLKENAEKLEKHREKSDAEKEELAEKIKKWREADK